MEKKNKRIYRNVRRETGIDSLICAPLVAVSKANMTMLSGQARFILDTCFTKEKDTYSPIMVSMSILRSMADGSEAVLNFRVPLLCLLPLNSLAVEEVRLNFCLDITSVSSRAAGGTTDIQMREAVLNGRIVRDVKGGNSASAHMKIDINAASIPLPTGTKTLIELYSKAILPNGNDEGA